MSIWEFLNQNFISSLFEALIFGLVAAYIFYKFSDANEKRSLTLQTRSLIEESINELQETTDVLIKQLEKNDVTRVPRPLDTTILRVLLQGKFTEVMNAELVTGVAKVYRISELINADYDSLHQTFNGVSVSIEGVTDIRNKIVGESRIRLSALSKEIDLLSKQNEKLKY